MVRVQWVISHWLSPTPGWAVSRALLKGGQCSIKPWCVDLRLLAWRSSALEVALGKTQANVSPESALPPHFQCPQSFVRGGYSTWDVSVPTSVCSVRPTMRWRTASWTTWARILLINYSSAAFILKPVFSAETKVLWYHAHLFLRTFFTRGFASGLTGNASFGHDLRMSLESTWFGVGLLLSLWDYVPRGWSVPV